MRILFSAVVLAAVALPLGAHAQTAHEAAGAGAGLTTGAVAGAIVGGPVGAAIGGAIGAIVGGTLSAPQTARVQQYVVMQGTPSAYVQEPVAVGAPLPRAASVYAVPADVGVNTQYQYSVLNERTVLVDPQTRRVIQVID
jgi:phage tail tape-measure protein